MLKIRSEQIETFSSHQAREFKERLAEYLRKEFPEAEEIPDDEFMLTIHQQMQKAESYGLTTEQQIASYVTCAWLLGLGFDKDFPAAQEMLTSEHHSPEHKRTWLAEWTEEIFRALETK